MKLLIVTQVVDSNHVILGFFHRWIEEFAKHCEAIQVICLESGEYTFPDNVTVHTLGKEEGLSKFSQWFLYCRLIFRLRKEYDNVFVHMNPIYVVAAGPLWWLLKKRVSLWYTHGTVSRLLRISEKRVSIIFTATKESCKLKSSKIAVVGHGIDVSVFCPKECTGKVIDIVTVGRIARSKNLLLLLEVLKQCRKHFDVTLAIVGEAVTKEEKIYQKELFEKIAAEDLDGAVVFLGKKTQSELPSILNCAKVFVTAAQNGSLDKAALEAMSCGTEVVSMAPGLISLPLKEKQVESVDDFVGQVSSIVKANIVNRRDYYDYVRSKHSLDVLIPNILDLLQGVNR